MTRSTQDVGAGQAPGEAGRAPADGRAPGSEPGGDPLWYRDAIVYEVHLRAFRDSTGDGTGDFRGLIEKLDYLRDLGVTAIWLLPFYPSPLRDDGYDIADYRNVNPAFGTMSDFRAFIRAAHGKGLRVITELVCNHTSDQHAWFQRARRARPGSAWRDFYVWSDTDDRYPDARIIFTDAEVSNWTWDPVARAYFWHRFYAHQPDLNFDNPRVRTEIMRAVDFWLAQGVDGLRLDAIPYLFERDGTDCENLPETHGFLRDLRRHVESRFPGRMLLAEANQWPEQAVRYFGDGDECQMVFHFPLMPRMFMAIRMEDRLPIVDILQQTPPIPEGSQWGLFLRNHDELTLEMVTDEERDYMVRVYASDPQARINLGIRRRLAPLLGNHRRRMELMTGLLFSLPGTPFIYYGDEIGMGDNVYLGDRDGMRTPMQWSADLNAGFSSAKRQELYLPVIMEPEYNYETVNVATQQANPTSLLWWMKRVIALRKRHPAFGRGSLEFLQPDNRRILAFVRRTPEETVLVVANLSRFFQPVELDLSDHEGGRPVELFGRVEFPVIGSAPYALSLGPHEFVWFNLGDSTPAARPPQADDLPVVPDARTIAALVELGRSPALSGALFSWISHRAWYRGRGRQVAGVQVSDRILLEIGRRTVAMACLSIDYMDGETGSYLVPLARATVTDGGRMVLEDGTPLPEEVPGMTIARLGAHGRKAGAGVLVDGTFDPGFGAAILALIRGGKRLRGEHGQLVGLPERSSTGRGPIPDPGAMAVMPEHARGPEIHGERAILHISPALDAGPGPGREMGAFLTDRGFAWIRPVIGAVEYRLPGGISADLALAQELVPREDDLLGITRDALLAFFEDAAASDAGPGEVELTARAIWDMAGQPIPAPTQDAIGSYLDTARVLGTRIGEMHRTLASAPSRPEFAPQPFTELYQRALFHAADGLATEAFRMLSRRASDLVGASLEDAMAVLGRRSVADAHLRGLLVGRVGGERIRTHGALRLDSILRSGTDLRIIDFEGDPDRPASERRLRRSPLSDVAALIGAYRGAALGRGRRDLLDGSVRNEDMDRLDAWARAWYVWVSAAFLGSYRKATDGTTFVPLHADGWVAILDAMLLTLACTDLVGALTSGAGDLRPAIRGVTELLGG